MSAAEHILRASDVSIQFGGVRALADVSFHVEKGQVFSIIGPNGAGKTSMLNCISGRYRPTKGQLSTRAARPPLDQRPRSPRHRPYVPESGPVQPHAVLDNIMVGRHHLMRNNFVTGMLYWVGGAQREEQEHRRKVEEIIDFLEIQHVRNEPAGTLPYGLRKRVELARAIALEPELILLDEPMAGMNLEEKEDMARFILDLNEEGGMTVVMIEHDMGVVMDISHRVMVLDFGRKIAEGTPEEVLANEHVRRAYLGEDDVPLHEQDAELVAQ